ncbi:YrhK family protein [Marinovum sp.]|uniref:YrhK family protein n=1 Tax=Marinovum sp. TaxID=2024839 RepID=UPI002B26E579|nr:YrhK family protein [Marinovum sp.]
MPLFYHRNRQNTPETRRIYAAFELAYTAVDFAAASCFIAGSVMFFFDAWQTAGTWMFLIGSILFATKPTMRFVRELRLAAEGYEDDLARRFGK